MTLVAFLLHAWASGVLDLDATPVHWPMTSWSVPLVSATPSASQLLITLPLVICMLLVLGSPRTNALHSALALPPGSSSGSNTGSTSLLLLLCATQCGIWGVTLSWGL